MAVVNELSSVLTDITANPPVLVGRGLHGARLQVSTATHTFSTDDATSTFKMVRLPTNHIIIGGWLQVDAAITSAGTATADVGLAAVDSNLTGDVDCLLDGVDIETAAAKYHFFDDSGAGVKNIEDSNKQIWDLLGASSDPGGFVDVMLTLNTTLTAGDGFKIVVFHTMN